MRLLVIGSEGQVATALREAAPRGRVDISTRGRPGLDVRNIDTIKAAIETLRPDIVVNAAAYTAVDLAETETETAFAINAQGAENVARAAYAAGIPVMHLSTDYVFDGSKDDPYTEKDLTSPQSVYGASKLAGEDLVAKTHPQHLILRTAWVYAPRGKNFVRTMLRVAMGGKSLRVVDDQHGNPTSSDAIADGILALAHAILGGERRASWGTFHMTSAGGTTWYGFASAIFEEAKRLGGPSADVTAITTAEYPTPAKRPQNSRLNSAKLLASYGVQLPKWEDSLRACMTTMAVNQWDVA